jgi:protein O-GlcNAc transferase
MNASSSSVDALFSSARALHLAGDLEAAHQAYLDLLETNHQYTDAWHLLGKLYIQLGQVSSAIDPIHRAIAVESSKSNLGWDHVKLGWFYESLGHAQRLLGDDIQAVESYRHAIELNPWLSDGWNGMVVVLRRLGRLDEALDVLRRASDIFRGTNHLASSASIANNLGSIQLLLGEIEPAIASFQSAIENEPRDHDFYGNWLMASLYSPVLDDETLALRHAQWNQAFVPSIPKRLTNRKRSTTTSKIRIGYLSPDFRNHAVNSFFESYFPYHDRQRFETFLYAEVDRADEVSHRLSSQASVWRSTVGVSDVDLSKSIRSDEIDILIDLAGHSAQNRLLCLVDKPASIQIAYLGYPHPYASDLVDYRIVDSIIEPLTLPFDSADANKDDDPSITSQKPLYLDPVFCCYRPNIATPMSQVLPAIENGYITFGSLHGLFKLNSLVLDTWCEILRQLPSSRLIVLSE